MTAPAPVVPPTVTTDPAEPVATSTAPPQVVPPKPSRPSLEDTLSGLDEHDRNFILEEVRSARNEAKGLRDRLTDAAPKVAEYDRLVEASKTDLQKAQDATAKERERSTGLIRRAVHAEIKAAATGFADPSDAVAQLGDTSKYANEDGEIDEKAIAADVAALLAKKPYLAGAQGGTRAPLPDPTLTGRPPRPEDIDQQIAEAEKAGNYGLSISLKRQKAAAAATKK